MRIIGFSIKNFRSITEARKIPIANFVVLVGQNNEGKSNILKGINIAMSLLKQPNSWMIRRNSEFGYEWERDFPIQLQSKKSSNKLTSFDLDFELTEQEIQEFKKEIKSDLNGILPIKIKIGEKSEAVIEIGKKGRGCKALNLKKDKILKFICDRIEINYIPAIRTGEHITDIISRMLSHELMTLEDNVAYQNALKIIQDLQTVILDELGRKIKIPLKKFINNIEEVRIRIPEERRRLGLRSGCEISIDDGHLTDIAFKGDGIKSLVALSLLHDRKNTGGTIVAIEEPEAHLHPGAMHGLNTVINELSQDSQIILSTHSPLFVNRKDIGANIIISSGGVKPAKKIDDVRKILGVKASDNLQNASYVLIVEGESDKTILTAILSSESDKIKRAIDEHVLIIESIGGAGNLAYKLTQIHNALCLFHVYLDNDDAGRLELDRCLDEGLLDTRRYTLCNCSGMANSEIEDCIKKEIYLDGIKEEFNVDLSSSSFRGNKKWSDRVKKCFEMQGKRWDNRLEAQVKNEFAQIVKASPINVLDEHKGNSVLALKSALEQMIISI